MNQAQESVKKKFNPAFYLHGAPPSLLSGLSLRTKGVWVLILFLAYTLAAGFIMGVERNTLYSDVQQLEAIHEEEGDQFGLNMLVTRAILVVNDNYYSADLETAAGMEIAARTDLHAVGRFIPRLDALRAPGGEPAGFAL